MKRRDFVKVGTGVMLGAPMVFAKHSQLWSTTSSPLAIAYSGGASTIDIVPDTDNLLIDAFSVDTAHIQRQVDSVVTQLTGVSNVTLAWESLFRTGQLSDSTKVGIKINHSYGGDDTLNGQWLDKFCPVGPKAAVSDAVINGLVSMLGGAFPIENITIFDKDAMGPWINNPRMAMQGYPSHDRNTRYTISAAGSPHYRLFDPSATPPGGAPTFQCGVTGNMVTQTIVPELYEQDFVINIAIPKVHQAGGITGTMKNTYGCTYDCGTTHGDGPSDGAPGVTACLPEFYRSQHAVTPTLINIMDAIGVMYDGSGAHHGSISTPNIIAASHDPVTLDTYLLELANNGRADNDLNDILLSDSMDHLATPIWTWPGGCNIDGYINAAHLVVAAQAPYSLGFSNTDLKLYEDVTSVASAATPVGQNAQSRVGAARRGPAGWRVAVDADKSGRAHTVRSRITDLFGRTVRSHRTYTTRGNTIVLDWDNRNDNGHTVAAGAYSWEITVDGRPHTQSLRLR